MFYKHLLLYNMGTSAFLINSQNAVFSAIGACAKKRDYTVCGFFCVL